MKVLLDMNLPPRMAAMLGHDGFEAVHWNEVGPPGAPDTDIMSWAAKNGHVVLTHDLDFGAMLAATGRLGPSVVQARLDRVTPDLLCAYFMDALRRHAEPLARGALLVIDRRRVRVRLLPLR